MSGAWRARNLDQLLTKLIIKARTVFAGYMIYGMAYGISLFSQPKFYICFHEKIKQKCNINFHKLYPSYDFL